MIVLCFIENRTFSGDCFKYSRKQNTYLIRNIFLVSEIWNDDMRIILLHHNIHNIRGTSTTSAATTSIMGNVKSFLARIFFIKFYVRPVLPGSPGAC